MSYDAEQLRRGLELADAPSFLVALTHLEDGQTSIETETGAEARISIDTFDGVRSATCEVTEGRILHRITAKPDHFLYEQISLADGAETLLQERLDFERICEPDPRDAIHEWLEFIEL
ncbi:hypothetical protein SAMN04488527_1648 [Aliiroseovarius crassostreae]|uniref:Uncharacterized protein n=1 Tax=Aliiroseovarius crassostreae TaxID=154981 RepID=A0A0P7KLL5_9RHOB|nr:MULTISPECIES: hypothetical protein [Rhodobacterales]KPN62911.1 hypothetical protein AKJ29_01840 [Aliiroseovarius crassostreae]UTS82761.1 hypothetical protein OL67_003871 [Phaeobacter piscinae]SFU97989.1 hypothetical protein SAMN04488527_1648 [Aliiroseovarius crassostreae]